MTACWSAIKYCSSRTRPLSFWPPVSWSIYWISIVFSHLPSENWMDFRFLSFFSPNYFSSALFIKTVGKGIPQVQLFFLLFPQRISIEGVKYSPVRMCFTRIRKLLAWKLVLCYWRQQEVEVRECQRKEWRGKGETKRMGREKKQERGEKKERGKRRAWQIECTKDGRSVDFLHLDPHDIFFFVLFLWIWVFFPHFR